MAIDTAIKRRNAAATGVPTQIPGVSPDATKPASWRRQVAWTYAFDTVVPPAGPEFDVVPGTWADIPVTGFWSD